MNNEMDPQSEDHLQRIQGSALKLINDKYRKGAAEHGGHLWEKENLIDEAINEAIDQVVYLLTLKEQMQRSGKETVC